MARPNKKKSEHQSQPDTLIPAKAKAIAGVAVALGVVMVYGSKKLNPPEGTDWLWYAGVIVAVLGAILWFISGMPREQALEWIKSGAFALVLALMIRWPIAEPYRIPSSSMEPTLQGGPDVTERADGGMDHLLKKLPFFRDDRVFVNKWIYGVRWPFMNKRIWHGQDPQRWDIVVFKSAEENPTHNTLVKRIVGMPGERVQIIDDVLHVNGKPLEIPDFMPEGQYYSSISPYYAPYAASPEKEFSVIPEGHYLVMGDNTNRSRDGRFFGWLPNENIVGRVASIWWPPSRWRDFTGFSQTLLWRGTVSLLGLLFFVRLLFGRSWVVRRPDDRKLDHYFVSFISYGLRIPFTNKWLRQWGTVERGELVLYLPDNQDLPAGTLLLGRVAGLPKEEVTIRDGQLHINGIASEASWWNGVDLGEPPKDALFGRGTSKANILVPEESYFILAEHPTEEDAVDSRMLGWVNHNGLLGKAVCTWWPLWRIRKL